MGLKTLTFFVDRELYTLTTSKTWQETALQSDYAIMAFSDHILFANQNFYNYFPGLEKQPLSHEVIEQWIPESERTHFVERLKASKVPPTITELEKNFHPVCMPLREQLSEKRERGVLCIHTLSTEQVQAFLKSSEEECSSVMPVVYLAVWAGPHLLSSILQEESLVLDRSEEGLAHIRVELKTGASDVLYISPKVAEIWEYDFQDLVRELLVDKYWCQHHIYELDLEKVSQGYSILQEKGELKHDYRITTAKQNIRWLREHLQLIAQDEEYIEFLADVQDVTQEKVLDFTERLFFQTYKALQQASNKEELFALLCKYLVEVPTIQLAWVGDVDTEQLKIVPISFCGQQTDYVRDLVIPLDDRHLSKGPSGEAWRKGLGINHNSETNPDMIPWREALLRHKLCSSFSMRLDVLNTPTALLNVYSDQPEFFNQKIVKMLKSLRDWVDQRLTGFKKERTLQHLTYFSRITSDPNLTSLLSRLNDLSTSSKESIKTLTLVYMNIKHFSQINSLWGMTFGNDVIRALSKMLHKQLKHEDEIYHVGADHFVLLLFNLPKSEVITVIQRLQEKIEQISIGQYEVDLEADFNIVFYPDDCDMISKLYEMAVLLEHQERDEPFRFFSREIYQRVEENSKLRSYLIKAIREKRFKLYFQPIVPTQTCEILHAEALIRLDDEDGKPLSPENFISIAENAHLINQITRLVIESAVELCAQWQKQSLPIGKIAINLSAQDVEDKTLLPFIEEVWLKHHVFPEQFSFEITERVAVSKDEEVLQFIEHIKRLSSEVELDDFGVGYSSLNMLNELEVAIIKIDKRFVDKLLVKPKTRSLVKTIIDTAHNLDAKTVAEGVEQAEQFEVLKEMGCDFIQGYYFAKPMPPEVFEQFVLEYTQSCKH